MSNDTSSDPLANKHQAWSALFNEPMSELVQRYTASITFDKRLWRADIEGSLAHAEMLAAQGVIAALDHADIQRGLAQIASDIETGRFEWKLALEDVHPTSKPGSRHLLATPASACTPAAAATTRSPPTCACGCAARSTNWLCC